MNYLRAGVGASVLTGLTGVAVMAAAPAVADDATAEHIDPSCRGLGKDFIYSGNGTPIGAWLDSSNCRHTIHYDCKSADGRTAHYEPASVPGGTRMVVYCPSGWRLIDKEWHAWP